MFRREKTYLLKLLDLRLLKHGEDIRAGLLSSLSLIGGLLTRLKLNENKQSTPFIIHINLINKHQ